ncbi:MAG: hypothetical protein Q7U72_10870 [Brevundimonas sp.]|jgi:hypothetical protein|uniref:hypothetical protein n=1 Tax=Brevundimonas sp. TaxID=1871086 RepID=UPI00271CCE3B|nr:hypothetical protein [Brevundimonas sp.]MDO9077935.1 hypothetical protein [Brevundimonas sp.]MDP3081414.1 hypothetical protein [Brevundimonas sp.]MDZ4061656.1 hypothetical protein [Brevundimonas sp.]
MTRKEVTGGSCVAVIWIPPLEEEKSQLIAESLLRESLKTTSVHRAVIGEASDTGDAYICFDSLEGEADAAVKAIRAFVETSLPEAGLEVLGPF